MTNTTSSPLLPDLSLLRHRISVDECLKKESFEVGDGMRLELVKCFRYLTEQHRGGLKTTALSYRSKIDELAKRAIALPPDLPPYPDGAFYRIDNIGSENNHIEQEFAVNNTSGTVCLPRRGSLSFRLADYARLLSFETFLTHGTMAAPPVLSSNLSTITSETDSSIATKTVNVDTATVTVTATATVTATTATTATTPTATRATATATRAATATATTTTTPTPTPTTSITSPPIPIPITDEEYLQSIMSLASSFSRHAILSGTERDVASVQMCRDASALVLEYCSGFDLRNGPLRRKFDGVKYALNSCEVVLYELGLVENDSDIGSGDGGAGNDEMEGQERKRRKMEEKTSSPLLSKIPPTKHLLLPPGPLEEIRQRMQSHDEVRELLIKRCRDAQKLAKKAIYALHRRCDNFGVHDNGNSNDNSNSAKNDYEDEASVLLRKCETIIMEKLHPMVTKNESALVKTSEMKTEPAPEPALRKTCGSYSQVIEEYVEAKLFQAWLSFPPRGSPSTSTPINAPPLPRIPPPHHPTFFVVQPSPSEYLGGLCDLTGEIGRKAVRLGTDRDLVGVKDCLATSDAILHEIETLQGGVHHKKVEEVRRNVTKMERVVYELSLVRMGNRVGGGGRRKSRSAEEEEEETVATAKTDWRENRE